MTIQYHLGKANVVAYALRKKLVSMGSLTYSTITKQSLANKIKTLEAMFIHLGIYDGGRVLATI